MSRADYMRYIQNIYHRTLEHVTILMDSLQKMGMSTLKLVKGMYGLKQAAIIAYSNIISHMDPHGYYTVPFTTVLWAHKTRRTIFCLCVDDFGVKCFTKDDANHILDSLKITMCSQQIGRVTINSDWQYIGTIARNMFTYR